MTKIYLKKGAGRQGLPADPRPPLPIWASRSLMNDQRYWSTTDPRPWSRDESAATARSTPKMDGALPRCGNLSQWTGFCTLAKRVSESGVPRLPRFVRRGEAAGPPRRGGANSEAQPDIYFSRSRITMRSDTANSEAQPERRNEKKGLDFFSSSSIMVPLSHRAFPPQREWFSHGKFSKGSRLLE